MLDQLSYLGNENLLFDSLKHHAGFEPAPSAWKAEILATIRMVQMMVLTYAPEGKEDYQQPTGKQNHLQVNIFIYRHHLNYLHRSIKPVPSYHLCILTFTS